MYDLVMLWCSVCGSHVAAEGVEDHTAWHRKHFDEVPEYRSQLGEVLKARKGDHAPDR